MKSKFNASWVYILILETTTLLLCIISPKIESPFSNFKNFFESLGEIFGLMGMVMFSLNFILAIRLSFIEKLFVGLNNVYKKHNFLGQIALILLIFHPLFLIPRYALNIRESSSFLFING